MKKPIVMIGPCDITAISKYINTKRRKIEIYDYNNCGDWNTCLSSYWVDSIESKKSSSPLVKNCCYPEAKLFNNNCSLIIMSILLEPQLGLYQNKYNGSTLYYGFPHIDARTNYSLNYSIDFQKYGFEAFNELKNYNFYGHISSKQVVDNYKKIIDTIGQETKICIVLGPTFPSRFGEQNSFYKQFDVLNYFEILNEAMKKTFKQKKNVLFIEPKLFYKVPRNKNQLFYYNFMSIAHYPKKTYIKIAFYLSLKYRKYVSFNYWSAFKSMLKNLKNR